MWSLCIYCQWQPIYKGLESLWPNPELGQRQFSVQPLARDKAVYDWRTSNSFPLQKVANVFFLASIAIICGQEAVLSLIYATAAAIKKRHAGYLSELLEARLEAGKQVP